MLLVGVLNFLFLVFVITLFVDRLQFDGIDRDHFEVSATFGTRENFALVDLVFIHIEVSFAFWAIKHESNLREKSPLLIFSFSGGGGQVLRAQF